MASRSTREEQKMKMNGNNSGSGNRWTNAADGVLWTLSSFRCAQSSLTNQAKSTLPQNCKWRSKARSKRSGRQWTVQSLLGVGNIDCLLGVSDARMGYLVWVLPFSAIFPMKAALVSVLKEWQMRIVPTGPQLARSRKSTNRQPEMTLSQLLSLRRRNLSFTATVTSRVQTVGRCEQHRIW